MLAAAVRGSGSTAVLAAVRAQSALGRDPARLSSRRCQPTFATIDGEPVQSFARERRVELSSTNSRSSCRRLPRRPRTRPSSNMAGSTIRAWSARWSNISPRSARASAPAAAPPSPSRSPRICCRRRIFGHPQDQGGVSRPPDRGRADQAADPRTLSQPDLPRPATPMASRRPPAPISTRMSASCGFTRRPISPSCRRRQQYGPTATRSARSTRRNWVLGRDGAQRQNHRRPARRARRRSRWAPSPRADRSPQRRRLLHGGSAARSWSPAAARRPTRALTASMPAAFGSAPPYDPPMQAAAEQALRDGLVRFERGRGWRDPASNRSRATGAGAPAPIRRGL